MIEVRELCKTFGQLRVLDRISLSIQRSQVSVLLGPSGSGKSTLLRTINGLESFDEGEIQVGEICLPAAAGHGRELALKSIRRRVGMVFQQFHLFPHRSVLENVIEAPIHVLGTPRQQAIETARALLERVGMADKLAARPATLSGGQQQRVAIARTLAMNPELILLDEPTSALDPNMTNEVTAVLADLATTGQTMVVVTHDMQFARTVAGRILVIDRGQIVETGSPAQIFDSPQHEATRKLLQHVG